MLDDTTIEFLRTKVFLTKFRDDTVYNPSTKTFQGVECIDFLNFKEISDFTSLHEYVIEVGGDTLLFRLCSYSTKDELSKNKLPKYFNFKQTSPIKQILIDNEANYKSASILNDVVFNKKLQCEEIACAFFPNMEKIVSKLFEVKDTLKLSFYTKKQDVKIQNKFKNIVIWGNEFLSKITNANCDNLNFEIYGKSFGLNEINTSAFITYTITDTNGQIFNLTSAMLDHKSSSYHYSEKSLRVAINALDVKKLIKGFNLIGGGSVQEFIIYGNHEDVEYIQDNAEFFYDLLTKFNPKKVSFQGTMKDLNRGVFEDIEAAAKLVVNKKMSKIAFEDLLYRLK